MDKKYIDVEAAKRMAVETVVSTMPDVAELLEKAIDNIPAANVAPVRRGRWEVDGKHPGYLCCSLCHDAYVLPEWLSGGKYSYCPNCGAKMDGE